MHLLVENLKLLCPVLDNYKSNDSFPNSHTFSSKQLLRSRSCLKVSLHAEFKDRMKLTWEGWGKIWDSLVGDSLNEATFTYGIEGHHESAQLMNDATQGPYITFAIVLLPFHNLRRGVTESTYVAVCNALPTHHFSNLHHRWWERRQAYSEISNLNIQTLPL